MHKGLLGSVSLNAELQALLNPRGEQVGRAGRIFRAGDKVMQIRNNYELEVFNGDLGRIAEADPEAQEVTVLFDGRPVVYAYADLDELVLGYACSIHKSQGSEYPAVVIPLHTQHYVLLQRNLLYTGDHARPPARRRRRQPQGRGDRGAQQPRARAPHAAWPSAWWTGGPPLAKGGGGFEP